MTRPISRLSYYMRLFAAGCALLGITLHASCNRPSPSPPDQEQASLQNLPPNWEWTAINTFLHEYSDRNADPRLTLISFSQHNNELMLSQPPKQMLDQWEQHLRFTLDKSKKSALALSIEIVEVTPTEICLESLPGHPQMPPIGIVANISRDPKGTIRVTQWLETSLQAQ